jgi:hypothetical protein
LSGVSSRSGILRGAAMFSIALMLLPPSSG